MAAFKDLSSPVYWEDFGRGAVGAAFMPKPSEAAETVLSLMARADQLEAELAETKLRAKLALQPLELAALRISNDLEEARASMRSALND